MNSELKLVYWVVLLVLVLLAVWYLNKLSKLSENFKSYPYTAGASMRITQSIPSTVTTPLNENINARSGL